MANHDPILTSHQQFVGKRVVYRARSGEEVLASCPHCGRHLIATSVQRYLRIRRDGKGREVLPSLTMRCPDCWYQSVLPMHGQERALQAFEEDVRKLREGGWLPPDRQEPGRLCPQPSGEWEPEDEFADAGDG